jgi:hypothetical protein
MQAREEVKNSLSFYKYFDMWHTDWIFQWYATHDSFINNFSYPCKDGNSMEDMS